MVHDDPMTIRRALAVLLTDEEPATVSDVQTGYLAVVDEAWKVLELVNSWVFHAEAKLGVTLAYLGALFAGLIAMVSSFLSPSNTILGLTGAAVALLLIGVVCAAIGILPRFKHSPTGDSRIYYRDIAALSSSDRYLERFKSAVASENVLMHLTQQIHAVSRVAERKFLWAHRAVMFGVASLLTTGLVAFGLLIGW